MYTIGTYILTLRYVRAHNTSYCSKTDIIHALYIIFYRRRVFMVIIKQSLNIIDNLLSNKKLINK